MGNNFLQVLNMSITASWIVLAVVIARFLLKKAPKWASCLLWAIVGLRLVMPFSFESIFSLIPSTETIDTSVYQSRPYIQTGLPVVDQPANEYLGSHYFEGVTVPANNLSNIMDVMAVIWIIGIVLMLAYSVISYLRLRCRVNESLLSRDNIYLCDRIDAPFILGIIKPRIYMPSAMGESDQVHVIAHEQAHLKRRDHWWKPIGFVLLAVYWFNPLMWVAYILLCRDIELACDEKVIKNLAPADKKSYSQALLACSVPHRTIAACPLAFGEAGVKERIKSVLNYKKPAFWIIIIAVIICIVLSVCFLTDPKADAEDDPFGHGYTIEEIIFKHPSIETQLPRTKYTLTEDHVLLCYEYNNWEHEQDQWKLIGGMSEINLTQINFDHYINEYRGESGWNTGMTAAKLRRNNQKAWVMLSTEEYGGPSYYLLQQKNGDVYLVYWNYDPEREQDMWSDDSYVRYIIRLQPTAFLSCVAVSEGIDAYMEPGYYLEGFDFDYGILSSGVVNDSGTLVFTAGWETDTLIVSEDYYEYPTATSGEIHKQTYELQRTSDGTFELEVSRRNDIQDEQAIYYIQGEDGVYIMKVHFPLAGSNIAEDFNYTPITSSDAPSSSVTAANQTVELFADAKTDIYNKMLNTIDHFNSVVLTMETSMLSDVITTVEYQVDINSAMAYQSVTEGGQLINETYSESGNMIFVSNNDKTYIQNYLPTYTRDDTPYIPLTDRITVGSDGIPSYRYRRNVTNCPLASYCLLPQELAFSYLKDFDKWSILDENVNYLGRNCIKIIGTPAPYTADKHSSDSFEMIVDSSTGVLMNFTETLNGTLSRYMKVTSCTFEELVTVKQFEPRNYMHSAAPSGHRCGSEWPPCAVVAGDI